MSSLTKKLCVVNIHRIPVMLTGAPPVNILLFQYQWKMKEQHSASPELSIILHISLTR